MDVHRNSEVVAVQREGERDPALVKGLFPEPRKLRRLLHRRAREDEVHACDGSSDIGYLLERMIRSWDHACQVVAL